MSTYRRINVAPGQPLEFTRSHNWLRLTLKAHGKIKPAPRRGVHRRRRPRQPMVGMLLHQDGSTHPGRPLPAGELDSGRAADRGRLSHSFLEALEECDDLRIRDTAMLPTSESTGESPYSARPPASPRSDRP